MFFWVVRWITMIWNIVTTKKPIKCNKPHKLRWFVFHFIPLFSLAPMRVCIHYSFSCFMENKARRLIIFLLSRRWLAICSDISVNKWIVINAFFLNRNKHLLTPHLKSCVSKAIVRLKPLVINIESIWIMFNPCFEYLTSIIVLY